VNLSLQTSKKAIAAFVLGLLSLGLGAVAIVSGTDLILPGLLITCALGIVLGILSLREMRRRSGQLASKTSARWGIGLSVGGLCLGFLLLPLG
jgi:hypothetical protein